jgi:hypothetical protein
MEASTRLDASNGSHAIARRLRAPERLCEKLRMWRPRSAAEPVATSLTAQLRQLDSTSVIPPGVDAEVDEYLNILMHL